MTPVLKRTLPHKALVLLGGAFVALTIAGCSASLSPTASSPGTGPGTSTSVGDSLATTTTAVPTAQTTEASTTTSPDVQRYNAALTRLLEEVASLPGISPGGWDPSHGAPYEAYLYQRDGTLLTMLATYADGDELAMKYVFGEGNEIPPSQTGQVDGWPVALFNAVGAGGYSAARLEGVCGLYDLWAFAAVPDATALADDVVSVADAASCPEG